MNNFVKQLEDALHDVGANCDSHNRKRPYDGQPHTSTGIRGATEIKGVTFRDVRDAYIRAMFLSLSNDRLYEEALKGEDALLSENLLYELDWDRVDPMAVCQNLMCEIEKIMGIFPNISQSEEEFNKFVKRITKE